MFLASAGVGVEAHDAGNIGAAAGDL